MLRDGPLWVLVLAGRREELGKPRVWEKQQELAYKSWLEALERIRSLE